MRLISHGLLGLREEWGALIVAAWVRAATIKTVARSSWSAEIHVGFASFDGLDDCSLSTAAGYEIESASARRFLNSLPGFQRTLTSVMF
jgi:hypothetical protein